MLQFLPAILALIGALAGSLIAPIVQWSIEKRRGKAAYRRTMIERWRKAVRTHDVEDTFHKFAASSEYSELRRYLQPGFRTALETGRTAFVGAGGRGRDGARTEILDCLAELERKWGLL